MKKTAVIQLAGFGDTINILPLIEILASQDSEPPAVYVQPEQLTLFENVSYAKAVSVNRIPIKSLVTALKKTYRRVLIAMPSGDGISYERRCSSFTMEAWDRCGMLPFWGQSRPNFDRRNRAREKVLVDAFIQQGAINILVNLSGKSSPFAPAKWIMDDLRYRHPNVNFINLAGVTAPSIVDLLGLFERANGLITSDTSTLHLAGADGCEVALAAFISDEPTFWHGSIPHRLPDLSIRYSEAFVRLEALHQWVIGVSGRYPTIYHLFSGYPGRGEDARRNALAKKTWRKVYNDNWRVMPVHDCQLPRMFDDTDARRLPFINDIIEIGFLHGARWVCLTNTDTCVVPDFDQRRFELLAPCGWAHRRDFKRLDDVVEDITKGEWYPGTDLFLISKTWWKENKNEMPDMILGAEAWDCLLRELMRERGGKELKDVIYHERHDSVWEKAENRYKLASQHFCLQRAREFFDRRKIDYKQFGIK